VLQFSAHVNSLELIVIQYNVAIGVKQYTVSSSTSLSANPSPLIARSPFAIASIETDVSQTGNPPSSSLLWQII
jgi:hypothetical protein